MAHVVQLARTLGRSERQVLEACRHLPGVLVLGAHATAGSRTREIDAVLLSPTGLYTIEAKGTRQAGTVTAHANEPWTVDGQPADFAGGPNPLRQGRGAAQCLRAALNAAGVATPFIPALIVVSGDQVDLPPTRLGDTWATSVANLPATLLRQRTDRVGLATAAQVLTTLGVTIEATELLNQGFTDEDPAPSPSTDDRRASSRDRRRERRRKELTDRADAEWRASHDRRLLGSLFAVAVMFLVVPKLPTESWVPGLLLAAAAGTWQLILRRRTPGPRHSGRVAAVLWLFSLAPVFGAGAALSSLPMIGTVEDAARWPLLLLLLLTALLLSVCTLAGRSGFIHPPAAVFERYDANGRPTGAFRLESDRGSTDGQDWRQVWDTPDPSTASSSRGPSTSRSSSNKAL